MDSRLITGAPGGLKLAGQRCRNWSDGGGWEGRKEREAGGATAPAGDGGDGGRRRRLNEIDGRAKEAPLIHTLTLPSVSLSGSALVRPSPSFFSPPSISSVDPLWILERNLSVHAEGMC